MARFAKSAFVYLLAGVFAFLLGWAALRLLDGDAGRAMIVAACLAMGVVAFGASAWPFDDFFLDTRRLTTAFLAVGAIVALLVAIDAAMVNKGSWTVDELFRHWKQDFHSWVFLLANIIFFLLMPFLLASIVRAAAVAILVNRLGVKPFGVASRVERRQLEETNTAQRRTAGLVEVIAPGAIFCLWPAVWSIQKFHDGEILLGMASGIVWLAGFAAICVWAHRRQWLRLWFSVPLSLAVFAVARASIWR